MPIQQNVALASLGRLRAAGLLSSSCRPGRSPSPADVEVSVMRDPNARQATALSRQDVELLRLLAQGLTLCSVARRVRTSERTVRRRTKDICDRLGVTASIQAVVWAARRGLV